MLLLLKLYVNLGRSMDKPIGIKGEFSTLKIDPNRDLRKEIELYCKGRYVKLGTVFNAFGTLAKARLGSSRNTTSLELNDPVELLSSSGIVREENGQLDTNVNIIVSKNGKARAGYSIMVRGTNAGHLGSFSLVDILSHGRACAVLNPYYTILFSPAIQDQLKRVAKIYSEAGFITEKVENLEGRKLAEAVAKAMIKFSKSIEFPTTLKEAGATEGHIKKMLEAAKDPQLKMKLQNMPMPMDVAAGDIEKLMKPTLYSAYTGNIDLIPSVI